MPTSSSDHSRSPEQRPHQHRQIAESFGVDAERYDRARPPYPDALIQRIVAAGRGPGPGPGPRPGPGPDVLDVGCGTGIEARQLKAAGCTVLGVEPDARMAEFARRTGIEVEVATFETWDAAGRTFDAVVAGQSWHWVDPDAGAAKAARVLRPGGHLTLFWHVFQPPTAVAEAQATVYQRVVPDSPIDFAAMRKRQGADAYQPMLDQAADGFRRAGGFGDPERWVFEWEKSHTRDEWLDLLPTTGALTRLPPDKLAEILDGVGLAIDAMGGAFTMTYTTVAVTAVRAGRDPGALEADS